MSNNDVMGNTGVNENEKRSLTGRIIDKIDGVLAHEGFVPIMCALAIALVLYVGVFHGEDVQGWFADQANGLVERGIAFFHSVGDWWSDRVAGAEQLR